MVTGKRIDDEALYEVSGLAQILGVTETTIRKLLRDGDIKGKKLGRKWYITGATIKAYFEDEKNNGEKK